MAIIISGIYFHCTSHYVSSVYKLLGLSVCLSTPPSSIPWKIYISSNLSLGLGKNHIVNDRCWIIQDVGGRWWVVDTRIFVLTSTFQREKSCIREKITLRTNADRSIDNIFFCPWSAMEVQWKFCGSAVKVPLKCSWNANSQQPTATATHLPLLTPPLSTVGWPKTVRINNLVNEKDPPFCSLTRGLHDTRKWVFRDVTIIHTDGHCNSMPDPAQNLLTLAPILKQTKTNRKGKHILFVMCDVSGFTCQV